MSTDKIQSSFRDPSGNIFTKAGEIYRQVNFTYKEDYDFLMDCGLYQDLTKSGLLIEHEEIELNNRENPDVYKILKPQPISFISYPYEWCFSQLKDAGLTTLAIQKKALEFGLINKVVKHESLMDECRQWAEKISANAPLAIQEMKRLFRHGLTQDFESHSHHVLLSVVNLFNSNDFNEAINAYTDKRPAVFKGN